MLEIELEHFNQIQLSLIEEYKEGTVVIKDKEVLGVFKDRSEALNAGFEKWGYISMLVRDISDFVKKKPPQKTRLVLHEIIKITIPSNKKQQWPGF